MIRTLIFICITLCSGCKLIRGSSSDLASTETSADNPGQEEQSGYFKQELIAPLGTFPANHGSTIVELNAGHLMACWFAGSKEAAADVQLFCSEKQEETSWSSPRIVVKQGEKSRGVKNKFVGNPVLFKDQEETVWLFYEAVKAFGHSASVIDFKVSLDNGQTFSDGQAFAGSVTDFGHLPRNKPVQLSSGRFMVPVYKEFPKKSGYVVMVTPDHGKIRDSKSFPIPGSEHLQPSLTIKEDSQGINKVFAYLRDKNAKKVLVSEFDFIESKFSNIQNANIPNPNAAVDAVTTEDNKILIVYNDSSSARSPLSLAVSIDGLNFKKIFDFETTPGEFSYPCLIKDKNNVYHLTYTFDRKTIKYVSFDAQWLATREKTSI